MRTFQHPDNGEHAVASGEAAETLLEEGWVELAEGPYEPAPSEEPEPQQEPAAPVEPTEPVEPVEPVEPTEPVEPVEPVEPTEPVEPVEPVEPTESTEPSAPSSIEAPEKPLGEMSMVELVAYGEKIGMPDAAALKKPGQSKAKAAEAISAFVAAIRNAA